MVDHELISRIVQAEQANRGSLNRIWGPTRGKVRVALEKLPGLEESLLGFFENPVKVKHELGAVILPHVESWCGNQTLLPLALTGQYIHDAMGNSLMSTASQMQRDRMYAYSAMVFDMSYGLRNVFNGVKGGILLKEGDAESFGTPSDTVKYQKTDLPEEEIDRLIKQMEDQDTLQVSLIEQNSSGSSLVDYWVRMMRNMSQELGWYNQPALRVGEFVVAGAEMGRKAYGMVYPSAVEMVEGLK